MSDASAPELHRYRLRQAARAVDDEIEPPLWRVVEPSTGQELLLFAAPELVEPSRPPSGEAIDLRTLVGRAQAIAALDDAFPPLYDSGVLNDGRHYAAWNCPSGENLRGLLDRAPLDLAEAAVLVQQILRSLVTLHDAGFAHCALRPATVFRSSVGAVRLPAAGLWPSVPFAEQTAAVAVRGWAAAAYLAPEQLPRPLVGEEASDVPAAGPATDLWACGVLLFELTSGHLPFTGRSFGAMARSIRSRAPEPIAALPGALPEVVDRIFERSLARAAADRYPNAAAMAADFEQLIEELGPRVRASPAARAPVPRSPTPSLPAGSASSGSEPMGGLLGLLERRQRAQAEAPPPLWLLLLPPLLVLGLVAALFYLLWRFG